MKFNVLCSVVLIAACAFTEPLFAQPGDGAPDLYYNSATGIISIDLDGVESGAMVINTPAGVTFDNSIFVAPNDGTWTSAMLNDAWQFVQTAPLTGPAATGAFDLLLGPTGLPLSSFPSPGGQVGDTFGGTFTVNYTKVPEPTAALIFLLGIFGLATFRNP